ncbi:hypothetical protein ITJ86_15520 [Winogradskyella sp. F6397]|uniref:Lipocalin-like domain-containing protein n=1 Tax=Winogradskyella marina TaxID=2785530 RepID=A0ABS0ERA3_9FLAO|nr:hypothetical protein [Winogradskyella marina]MBF8151316.1 hypothetical protein [Winogradskyella marina]
MILTLTACSSSDDSSSNNQYFNPPSWIQGTWTSEHGQNDFRFTSDDFCYILASYETCYKEGIESGHGAIEAIESITENSYEVGLSGGGTAASWSFIKISNTEIELVNPIEGIPNTLYYKIN